MLFSLIYVKENTKKHCVVNRTKISCFQVFLTDKNFLNYLSFHNYLIINLLIFTDFEKIAEFLRYSFLKLDCFLFMHAFDVYSISLVSPRFGYLWTKNSENKICLKIYKLFHMKIILKNFKPNLNLKNLSNHLVESLLRKPSQLMNEKLQLSWVFF